MCNMTNASNQNSPKICIIGAGFSGLCAAIQLKRKLKLTTFTVFESRYDIGGVWLANSYPGCASNIQSHLYSFSFEPNPYWTSNYPPQEEIWAYQKKVVQKYNLYSHIQLNTEVKSLTWDEELRKWRTVIVENINNRLEKFSRELTFDIVINASGRFRVPNIPREFQAFKGLMAHSGDWNPTIQFDESKIVGIVGTGASAAQIIPAIAGKIKTLHVYQRKAPWIAPCTQFSFSDRTQWIFAHFPFILWIFRCLIFLFYEIHVTALRAHSLFNKIAPIVLIHRMKRQLAKKPRLLEELIPKYPFGCNQIVVSSDYFQALTLPQVHVHTSPITQVTKDTIFNANGEQRKIDILILATGFRTQDYFGPMTIIGRKGENILNTWQNQGPKLYLGVTCNSMPNLFVIQGPNSSPGSNSILFMIECQVEFTIKLISTLIRRKRKVVNVKPDAEEYYFAKLQKSMKLTTWGSETCRDVINDQVINVWPLNSIKFWKRTRKIKSSHFDFY